MNQKGSPLRSFLAEGGQTQVLILAGIVLAIASAGGIFYLGRATTPKTQTPSTTSSPQPSPTPTNANREPNGSAETASWKTYTSTTGKFYIRYPIEWKVLNAGGIDTGTETISFGPNITSVTEDPNTKVWIQMQSTTNSASPIKSAEDYKNSLVKGYGTNPDSNLSVTSAIVDGVNGFKVTYIDAGVRITNIIIDKNELIYSIALRQIKSYLDQDQQTFDQILSTFKFLP